MNIITLCSIEKTDIGYRVRYLRNNTFHHVDLILLASAIKYCQDQLQADRDEILLSISK